MILISKEIRPAGPVSVIKKRIRANKVEEVKEMKVTQMVAEYRFCGILIYRKKLLTPYYFSADCFRGFNTKF